MILLLTNDNTAMSKQYNITGKRMTQGATATIFRLPIRPATPLSLPPKLLTLPPKPSTLPPKPPVPDQFPYTPQRTPYQPDENLWRFEPGSRRIEGPELQPAEIYQRNFHPDFKALEVTIRPDAESLAYGDFIIRTDEKIVGRHIVLFTDGSQTRNRLGLSVTCKSSQNKMQGWEDIARGVCGKGSNNTAEYLAIGKAMRVGLKELERIADSGESGKGLPTIIIISDSAGSIRKISNNSRRPYREPIRSEDHWLDSVLGPLHTLSLMGARVWLHWIRGHKGNEGNARADFLAGLAVRKMIKWYEDATMKEKEVDGYQLVSFPELLNLDEYHRLLPLDVRFAARAKDRSDGARKRKRE
ncbi:hypothetical protein F4778DRAFT_732199 [Xylariomycetidae sp. FL2044]|nr:hypothetical protein F4778DRAFT_732199 [Xylariomycetidae sp. FL2044]